MTLQTPEFNASPLLTFVVINWNYADFITSTISSIKNQTYNYFQCIIVDNGSDDDSLRVIREAIGNDERFEVVETSHNLGHLGAFLSVFHLIRGEFISIVDSDDFLFPSYATAHLQAHLSFSSPVGVSTSNLVEVGSNGSLISGSRTTDWQLKVIERPKASPELRIQGIDEELIARLADATVRISKRQNGWLWFPGTSNVFRRAPLEAAIKLKPNFVPVKHFADTFLLGTCHVLEGTAFIDVPLSAYRRHNQNTENTSEIMKLGGLRVQRRQAANRAIDQRRQLCASLFQERDALRPWIDRDQIWTVADHLLRVPDQERPFHYGSPVVRRAIESRLIQLAKEFGALELWERLRERMSLRDILRCLVGALRHVGGESARGGG